MRTSSRVTAVCLLGMLVGCATTPGADPTSADALGPRLSSARLQDENASTWATLEEKASDNPLTRVFSGASNKMASYLKASEPKVIPAEDPISLRTKTEPSSPGLHVAMARMVEQQGNHAAAEDHYQKALAKDPGHLDALLGYAHLLDRQNKLAEASKQYETACQRHPRSARAANDLGLCYARQKRADESIDTLLRAVQLNPKKALYRNNLATVLAEQNEIDEALVHLKAAHPPAVAHYNLGFLLQKKGDKVQAAEQFAIAARIDPNLVAAQNWVERLAVRRPQSSPLLSNTPRERPTTLTPQRATVAASPRPLPAIVVAE